MEQMITSVYETYKFDSYHNGRTIDLKQEWDEFEPGFQDIVESWNGYMSHCFGESSLCISNNQKAHL